MLYGPRPNAGPDAAHWPLLHWPALSLTEQPIQAYHEKITRFLLDLACLDKLIARGISRRTEQTSDDAGFPAARRLRDSLLRGLVERAKDGQKCPGIAASRELLATKLEERKQWLRLYPVERD